MKLFQFTKNFDRSLLSTMFVVIGMFKKVVTIKSAISMDSSPLSILQSQVRIPSKPSTLLPFVVKLIVLVNVLIKGRK